MEKKEMHSAESATTVSPILAFSLANPLITCFILYIIAVFIRWIDNFVLEMDIRLGELIITKSMGFVVVLIWLGLSKRKVRDIGLHTDNLGFSLLIGALPTLVAFVVGYGIEFIAATLSGSQPRFQVAAVDSKMGVTGGILFPLFLVFGNFVNSFMEEGLFRGVMGRLGRTKFSLWRTNWFQAILFGIWHLPWVLRYYQLGDIQTGGDLAQAIFFNSVPQLFIGIVYGYYYFKTSSLWSAWIAHTISNSVLNLVHVVSLDGTDTGIALRMATNLILMLLSMIWVRHVTNKHQMAEITPFM